MYEKNIIWEIRTNLLSLCNKLTGIEFSDNGFKDLVTNGRENFLIKVLPELLMNEGQI